MDGSWYVDYQVGTGRKN